MSRIYSITQLSDLFPRVEPDQHEGWLTRLRFLPFTIAAFLFDSSESSF